MTDHHNQAAEAVIAAELTRCILSGDHRPELRMDVTGALARFVQGVRAAFEAMMPPLQRLDHQLTVMSQRMAEDAERYANRADQ